MPAPAIPRIFKSICRRWRDILIAWGLIAILPTMIFYGLRLRDWTWDVTIPIRFQFDVGNGYDWGKRALHQGYFNIYDTTSGDELDYAPLRLGVMSIWLQWLDMNHNVLPERDQSRDFHWPVLMFNTCMELLASIGVLMVVRYWSRCRFDAGILRWYTGLPSGLFGFALFWFNPAILLEAHAWPQWDVWVLPGFIWAIYFGGRRWWMAAGLVLGLTGMLKGQILFSLPLFIIWPIFRGQWMGMLKVLIGFAASTGIIGAVWETTQLDATQIRHILWPALIWVGFCTLPAILLPRHHRMRPDWVIALGGLGLLSCMLIFSTSSRWIEASYFVGKDHYPALGMGNNTNLGVMLNRRFGFHANDVQQIAFTINPKTIGNWPAELIKVRIRPLLVTIFLLLSTICAIAAARHERQKDIRFLIAVSTPWLIFFAIMPQMHERYLLFYAGAAALLAGVSIGTSILGHLISWLAMLNISADMIPPINYALSRESWQYYIFFKIRQFSLGIMPEMAWALLLAMLIFLWLTITSSHKPLPIVVQLDSDQQPLN